MSILSSIINGFGGSIIKEGFDAVKTYFPPSMTEKEKGEARLAYERVIFEKQRNANELSFMAEKEFSLRIKEMEGTVSDLKSVPVFGSIIIFIRGAQRPVWGCFTMYADFMVLSHKWNLVENPELKSMLFAINILVLGFLFGERAVKNLMPFFSEFLNKRKS